MTMRLSQASRECNKADYNTVLSLIFSTLPLPLSFNNINQCQATLHPIPKWWLVLRSPPPAATHTCRHLALIPPVTGFHGDKTGNLLNIKES